MRSVPSDTSEVGAPQEVINDFWENLITKKPAKVTKIFPASLYAHLLPPKRKPGTVTGKNAAESYQAAANECRARVERIVKECHRTNEKFTDPDFDIEDPNDKNCLEGLAYWYKDPPAAKAPTVNPSQLGSALSTLIRSDVLLQNAAPFDFITTAKVLNNTASNNESGSPGSVHRVDWIFEKPQFEIDGYSSTDVVQGANGDCWFIAAVATICSNPDLINKVCVKRDEECGVYGFVFYRDGEWIWTVVDDNLYLKCKDFDAYYDDTYDPTGIKETRYRKNNQTGSSSLYFASCADENETWLPLLEKAYAKVHGDYGAISGGWSGEAVEDLTGGVTTKILTDRILSKERLWKELLQVNKLFLFSASSPDAYGPDSSDARRGLALSHAYSVLKAVDVEGEDGKQQRLVLVRNPWGKRQNAAMGEWTGPWSDGSREWTPYWLNKLEYRFGDDGIFWMSYDDMLKRFDLLDRTRLFDQEWTVVQHWTSVSVAWVTGFLNTKFSVEIKKAGPTVFVLCNLDDRYFRFLEGKYDFDLHFILQKKNAEPGEHLVRARGAWFGNRSISAEVHLEAGTYEVLPKIEASRDADAPDVHEVVTKLAELNPQKLRQIGLNYDIANAKGVFELSEEERKLKEQKREEGVKEKRKAREVERKERADFEAWRKEEKAEYEAWKKEKKEREEKEKPKEKETVPEPEPMPAPTESEHEPKGEVLAIDLFLGLTKSQKKKLEKKMMDDAKLKEAETKYDESEPEPEPEPKGEVLAVDPFIGLTKSQKKKLEEKMRDDAKLKEAETKYNESEPEPAPAEPEPESKGEVSAVDPFLGLTKSQKKKLEKKIRDDAKLKEAKTRDSESEKEETDTRAEAVPANGTETKQADSSSAAAAEEVEPELIADLSIGVKSDSESAKELTAETPSGEKAAAPQIQVEHLPGTHNEAQQEPDDERLLDHRDPRASLSVSPGFPPYEHPAYANRYPGGAYDRRDASPPRPPLPTGRRRPSVVSNQPRPWNAVCVLGLRVYSQDPEVSIKLVNPKDVEEGAILDVDGDTAAGATM